jgi:molybdenum cofactor guanylyltransferase
MIGLILCGGLSSRMKEDKGLMPLNGKAWAALACEKISTVKLRPMLSIRKEQAQTYSSIFKRDQLIVDDEGLNLAGPLLGIMSAHLRFQREDMVVLACDLLKMERIVMIGLIDEQKRNRDSEAIIFKSGGRSEPLCGIYTSQGLAKILSLHREKGLVKFSMMHVLEILKTRYVAAHESWTPYFKNFNSQDDLVNTN